jgi:hypothetical protein
MGKRGVGESLLGGKEESTAWDDDDVGLEMKWLAFYILYTMAFLRARGEHILLFALLLLLELCFSPCILYFGSWNKLEENSSQAWKRWNLRRFLKLFALKWKIGGLWKCLRQTFAPDEKCMRPLKNVRAKPLRLMRNVCGLWKMFAPNLCAWWEMYAAFEKCSRQTSAPDEKCMRPLKNVPRQTFAPDEKCMRPLKNVRAKPLRLMRNVCGLWKMELK